MEQMWTGKSIKRIFCFLAMVLLLVLCPAISVQSAETRSTAVQTVEVGIPVEERPELFLPRSMPTHGVGKIAVFLIDFPDYPNDNPTATQDYYDKLYFSGGVRNYWANISVAEFFEQESYGKLNVSGQVFDWYTAKHNRSYYDNRKAELIIEAAEYYKTQGVDFSQFDGDGDGTIDSVVYHFSGEYSSDNQDDPWYSGVCHSTAAPNGWGQISGLKFTKMVQVYEGASSGTSNLISIICHELMHTLGMPDLYGKVYFNLSPGRDLMIANEYGINPYTKILLGWLDTVQVITGQADDVRLDVYGNKTAGDVAIVAESFDGFFGEFYVVAYRQFYQFLSPTIWHIDARIDKSGTAFLCDNLYYDPRPDKDTAHSVKNPSPYLFIEELSADFNTNYVLLGKSPSSPETGGFGVNSVLGSNSMPSSDTHDGAYTGIRIHNFVEHNEEYLTFDVSVVKDTAAPVLVTREDDLQFVDTITLSFNEYIYEGKNWENIYITDLDGNEIKATVLRPHYPCNEIEIAFQTDVYLDGYIINLPEGCIQDSSGNRLGALTVSATKEDYFFATSEQKLPNPGYIRSGQAYFFPQKDSLVVITGLFGETMDAKIEFMRLGLDGTVLAQTIVDNPFEMSEIVRIAETGDGSYILICQYQGTNKRSLLLCLDQNGNIKWTNADSTTELTNYSVSWLQTEKGIQLVREMADSRQVVHIHSEDGTIECVYDGLAVPDYWTYNVLNLPDGKMLCQRIENGNVTVQIIDQNSKAVEAETVLRSDLGEPDYVAQCQANADGTIMLYCYIGEKRAVLLLDARLNLIKAVSMSSAEIMYRWIPNNGFVDFEVVTGNHENNRIRVSRYDRYLNKIWETDVEAYNVYFFESSSGEIMAYRSMWEPEKECYIDYYGSEEKFRTAHIHNLVHKGEVPSTCLEKGMSECWQCMECGCFFSDEGKTVAADIQTLMLPKGDHSYGDWEAIREPTAQLEGIGVRTCDICGGKEYGSIPKLPDVTEPIPTDPAEKNQPMTIVIIAVICVVVLGCVAFIILKKKSKKCK